MLQAPLDKRVISLKATLDTRIKALLIVESARIFPAIRPTIVLMPSLRVELIVCSQAIPLCWIGREDIECVRRTGRIQPSSRQC